MSSVKSVNSSFKLDSKVIGSFYYLGLRCSIYGLGKSHMGKFIWAKPSKVIEEPTSINYIVLTNILIINKFFCNFIRRVQIYFVQTERSLKLIKVYIKWSTARAIDEKSTHLSQG